MGKSTPLKHWDPGLVHGDFLKVEVRPCQCSLIIWRWRVNQIWWMGRTELLIEMCSRRSIVTECGDIVRVQVVKSGKPDILRGQHSTVRKAEALERHFQFLSFRILMVIYQLLHAERNSDIVRATVLILSRQTQPSMGLELLLEQAIFCQVAWVYMV